MLDTDPLIIYVYNFHQSADYCYLLFIIFSAHAFYYIYIYIIYINKKGQLNLTVVEQIRVHRTVCGVFESVESIKYYMVLRAGSTTDSDALLLTVIVEHLSACFSNWRTPQFKRYVNRHY